MRTRLLWTLLLLMLTGCDGAEKTPPGYQGIVEHDERHLGFQIGGRIKEIHFDRGDRIDAGDLLAVLDETMQLPRLRASEADVARAKAEAALVYAGPRVEEVRATVAQLQGAQATLKDTKSNLDRHRALLQQGATPESLVADLEAAYGRARAELRTLEQQLKEMRRGARPEELLAADAKVKAAEAALAAEEERLELYALESMERVTVLDVPVRIGEVLAAGATVMTVADTTHPYVDVFVPQAELSGLRVGTPAEVRVDAESDAFEGSIEHIAPTTEFTPRFLFSSRERPNLVVRVRVRIEDPEERLHAGVPAFATLASKGP
jgi:HlyD family secretion protein